MVLRVARIHAIATKHKNEEWNQEPTRRGKLQTGQVNAEQRPRFLQDSKCKERAAGVTTRKMSKSSRARRVLRRDPSGDVSPPRDQARGGPGLGSTSPERSKARRRQCSAERPGLALELELPFSPFIAPLYRNIKIWETKLFLLLSTLSMSFISDCVHLRFMNTFGTPVTRPRKCVT